MDLEFEHFTFYVACCVELDMSKLPDICPNRRLKTPQNNAARERSRVKTLRTAFLELQRSLPAVPPNTKLSKLDILVLATAYIYRLTQTLQCRDDPRFPETNPSPADDGGQGFYKTSDVAESSSFNTSVSTPSRDCKVKVKVQAKKRLTNSCVACRDVESKYLWGEPWSRRCQEDTYHPQVSNIWGPDVRRPVVTNTRIMQSNRGILHPVKKWPMRSRLYDSIFGCPGKTSLLTRSVGTASYERQTQHVPAKIERA
ncbi:uncharacterized protein LOC131928253 [Physella acuta]|uniref:uncharacterized protein LOC131928253 n=1 Tax=Physella acuta TaxID=109671 RepID=UPI0027DD4539|nr:uncharacterized protein LOC131928253 [Physella acuta]